MLDFPSVKTKRLIIRELTLQDVNSIFKHFSNPEVTKFMDIEVCTDITDAEEIITFHLNDSGCRYGMFSKETNELIGTCGYHCWIIDSGGSRAEIGFDLTPSYWGKGLMQEALNEVLKIGFEIMELDYIEATTELENIKSQKLLVRMGFNKEIYLKDNLLYFTLRKKRHINSKLGSR